MFSHLHILFFILIGFEICFFSYAGASDCDALLTDDLAYTLNSIENMRSENGLLHDTIWIRDHAEKGTRTRVLNSVTSPTNIAVDILVQSEIGNKVNLKKAIDALLELETHKESGLFFSWYSTKSKSPSVKSYDVSSVDNLHLALALWTIAAHFPDEEFAKRADKIFKQMDFSLFYDPDSNLIGGNLKHFNGEWTLEAYRFSHFGSEARILYSLGWALDVFKKIPEKANFIERAIENLTFERSVSDQGEILKLWDGALFQLYFPKIFIGEERYSTKLRSYFESTARLMDSEGKRRGLLTPAAHSPGRRSCRGAFSYKDKSGLKVLVSNQNRDMDSDEFSKSWEELFTPYALFMAATSRKIELIKALDSLRDFRSKQGQRLYLKDLGWMDGLIVEGPRAETVVPAQLALNQNMIALSLFIMNAKDGLSLSARTLAKDPMVSRRLKQFYQMLDRRLSNEN